MKVFVRYLIAPLTASLILLAGCGRQDVGYLMNSARGYLEKRETSAAIIQLKLALAQNANLAEARFLLGKALLQNGDATGAAVELHKAMDLGQAFNEVAPLLATAWLASRKEKELIDEFADLELDNRAALADLKTSLAAAYAAIGDPEKAQNSINAAFKAVPDNPATLRLQASFAFAKRDVRQALELNDRVLSTTPSDPLAWIQRGEILFAVSDSSVESAVAFRKALSFAPNNVAARSGLILQLLRQNDSKAAGDEILTLQKISPDTPGLPVFQAQLAYSKKEYRQALEFIGKALKLMPENVNVLQLAGAIQLSNGQLLQAERTLGKALTLEPELALAHRQLAQTLLRMGQPAKALTALQPLIGKSDGNPLTYALAGEANVQLGRFEQAEQNFSSAVKLNPENLVNRTLLAVAKRQTIGLNATIAELESISDKDAGTNADMALVALFINTNQLNRALKAVDAIDRKQPNTALGPNLRGNVYMLIKDEAMARSSFERALVVDPVFVPAAEILATLDLESGKPAIARKRIESVLAVDPKNLRALLAFTKIRVIEGAPKTEIADLLDKAIKFNPADFAPRLLLIDHYLAQRDVKAAQTVAEEASAELPNNPEILDALGRAQMAAGSTQQAINSFSKLASLEPRSTRAYVRLAGIHLAAKNMAAAEQSLRKALSIAPDFLPVQRLLVSIAQADNRPQDAIAIARIVQQSKPKALAGYSIEAAIETSRNNVPAAIEVFRRGLKINPRTEFAIKLHSFMVNADQRIEAEKLAASWMAEHGKDIEFLSYLGDAALLQGRYDSAERHFRALVTLQPGNVGALNNLAFALVKQNKGGAIAYAQQALKLQPNTPGLMDTLAMALAAEKEIDRALALQTKALALEPGNPVLRLNLAKLLLQTNDKSAAKKELNQLAALGPKFPAQPEVSRLLKSL